MFSYLSVYCIACIFFVLGEKYQRYFCFFIGLFILWLFGGLRYGVGLDYNGYWDIFLYADSTGVELGYRQLCLFFRSMGFGPQIMYLVSTALTLSLIYKAVSFYNRSQVAFAFAIFLFAGFYTESFNISRQYIAIGFFIYATRYIFLHSFGKYLLIILIGSLFHSSILFMLPFYWLLDLKYSDSVVLVGILLSVGIAYTLPLDGLYEKIPFYGRYMLEDSRFNVNTGLGLGYMSKVLIALLLLKLRHCIIAIDNKYNVVINGFFFYILFMAAFKDFMVLLRIAYYFHIFLILLLPRMVYCFNRKSQKIFLAASYLYLSMLFIIQITDKTAMLIPYRINLDLTTTVNLNQ